MPRRDRLEHGAHADGVRAERAQHPHLRRRLVLRPEHPRVHAAQQLEALRRGDLVRERAERRIVGARHVGEAHAERALVRPRQRALRGHVEVILEQHQVARDHPLADAARGVRDEDRLGAERDHQPHAEDDVCDGVPLVEVHAPLHRRDAERAARHGAEHEVPRVPDDARHRHPGHLRERQHHAVAERVRVPAEPRAEHQPDLRRDARLALHVRDGLLEPRSLRRF